MNELAWLEDWFKTRAPELSLAPETNYFDAGAIDSFGVIELIEDAESTFDIRFTEADFQDRRFSTIAGLAAIIEDKGAG